MLSSPASSTMRNPEQHQLDLYALYKLEAMPPLPLESVAAAHEEITVTALEANRSLDHCLAGAAHGDLPSLLHLGLRSLSGLGTPVDRNRAVNFFNLATHVRGSSREDRNLKATAHALLLESLGVLPHNQPCPEPEVIVRGEWHANEAVRLRPNEDIPGSIMMFCSSWQKFKELSPGTMQCEDLWKAVEKQRELKKMKDDKLNNKKKANPGRYQCAALGCRVQAPKGKALSKCAGMCDDDFKPAYCSKECQKKDWTRHKPFCRPGAVTNAPLLPATADVEVDHDIELVTKSPRGMDVSVILQDPKGKLVRLTGQREVIKNARIVEDPVTKKMLILTGAPYE